MLPNDLARLLARRDSLDSLILWLGWWMIFFTALVVAGLCVEYRQVIIDAWRERRWKILQFWRLPHMVLGGVLITGGVAGELLIDFFASRTETELRIIGGSVEAHFNAEAAKARDEAAKANERASQNAKETAAIRLEEAKLREQVAEMGPRTDLLSGTRLRAVIEALLPFKGQKAQIGISWPDRFTDNETSRFSKVIEGVLRESKWDVLDLNAVIFEGGKRPNVGVSIGYGEQASRATRAAANALRVSLAGVPIAVEEMASGRLGNDAPAGDVVLVLVKPHSFGGTAHPLPRLGSP